MFAGVSTPSGKQGAEAGARSDPARVSGMFQGMLCRLVTFDLLAPLRRLLTGQIVELRDS